MPKVKLSVKPIDFDNLTVTEIMAAGQFGGQLYPNLDVIDTGGDPADNLAFAQAMEDWNKHEFKKAALMLKQYLKDHPEGAWASEAELHLGCDAHYNGRYTEAEQYFLAVLDKNKDKEFEGARRMANKARLRLATVSISQNNPEGATALFHELLSNSDDWRDQTYASHWIQRLSRAKEDRQAALNCGVLALSEVLKEDGRSDEAGVVAAMTPDTEAGFSMLDLRDIAAGYGYDLAGWKLSADELDAVPLPAIIQLSGRKSGDSGHFWVVEQVDGGKVRINDPKAARMYSMGMDELAGEWDGNALLLIAEGGTPGAGEMLADDEMGQLFGGCCGVATVEDNTGNVCGPKNGPSVNSGCQSCGGGGGTGTGDIPSLTAGFGEPLSAGMGSPTWKINMVNINLFVTDTPIWYDPPIGPPVRITVNYNSQSATAYYEPFGDKWQFNYASYLVTDTNGNVTIFMPDGRRDDYKYNYSSTYTSPNYGYNTLTKKQDGSFELKFQDGSKYTYSKPSGMIQDVLTGITDQYGQSLTLGYNEYGQLDTITDAVGGETTLTYTNGRVTSVTDPYERTATFGYTSGKLTSITDMGGYSSSLTYTGASYISSIGNSRGTWDFYVEPSGTGNNGSDAYPRIGGAMWESYRLTITNPEGGKEEYFYNGYDNTSWYVSPDNYIENASDISNNFALNTPKTKYWLIAMYVVSDPFGRIASIKYPDGGITKYSYGDYNNRSRPTAVQHRHSSVKFHTYSSYYNANGNETRTVDPRGNAKTIGYAANGLDITSVTDGLGTVNVTYDAFRNVSTVTDRMGYAAYMDYNQYGQPISVKDAEGGVTTYTYYTSGADIHRLQKISRGGEDLYSFTYYANGRVLRETGPTGLVREFEYNGLGSVTKITYDPDGAGLYETFSYSTCCPGLLEAHTDRAGKTTSYEYDSLKRLVELTRPDGTTVKYEYDGDGNMVKLTDSNSRATTFAYDLMKRPVKKTYADGKSFVMSYDKAGLLTTRTNGRGIITTYSYNNNDVLTKKTYSDGTTPNVQYTYDSYDRMTQAETISVEDGIGKFKYYYDDNSRLTAIQSGFDTYSTITYGYDGKGRRTSLRHRADSSSFDQTITYAYDTVGRLDGITVGSDVFDYVYPAGTPSPLPEKLARPNGAYTGYAYDGLDRLTGVFNNMSGGVLINSYEYSYVDPATSIDRDLRTSEKVTDGRPLLAFIEGAVKHSYDNVNQINTSTSYEFDADGNMTKGLLADGSAFTATYDAESRLSTFQYTIGSDTYVYQFYYTPDGFVGRFTRTKNGTTEDMDRAFVRDGYLELQERGNNNDDLLYRAHAWDPSAPGGIGGALQHYRNGDTNYYFYDGRGDVTALINDDNTMSAVYNYDPFGDVVTEYYGTPEYQMLFFSTKRIYSGARIYDFGYRFYAPWMGRWLNRDPLGEAGGLNLYGFVGNSPINLVDPDGQYGVVAGVVGVVGVTLLGVLAAECLSECMGGEIGTDPTTKDAPFDQEGMMKNKKSLANCIHLCMTPAILLGGYACDPIGSAAQTVGGEAGQFVSE